MSETVLQVNQLCKSYGKEQVLQNLSFNIEQGQIVALLGRNGAGKTTTIRALMGLIEPNSGDINLLGFSPQAQPIEIRKRIGYLAEDQKMYGWMTVIETIQFVSAFFENWDHNRVRTLLQQFELPPGARVKTLSKGQNIRLGLLLALAHHPQMVILDDPVLGLDPIMRKEFNRDLITHLQAENCTVLYSSHLLYEVEPIADVVMILNEGRILRQAATEELKEDVKRLIFSKGTAPLGSQKMRVIDVEQRAKHLALIVENFQEVKAELDKRRISYEVQDLNLDEIFEAYVSGRSELPYNQPDAVEV
ncbi:putative ABC transporter ATP-binding protein YxlF [Polystyrenella longa]|uniref:Putative ABC transporter ATP-binding protein YxlF n=1 Tax=Polystyrenella longa TaxID=2528007 RepID=A0A518CSW6_9PLAN|nr:ABC transporter ATP-binding protein [Polystyrenella longa]QDU82274.1 putative ABC transporter ATP-binding protein YxlF [Polystyrenella longa]